MSSRLRPRMGLIICLLQPLNRDMRINLRRRKALVAEQGLNAAKIGAVIQQMSGKAMPELVRSRR